MVAREREGAAEGTGGGGAPLRGAALAAGLLEEAWSLPEAEAPSLRAAVTRELARGLRAELEALAGAADPHPVEGALRAADVASLGAASLEELPEENARTALAATHLAAGAARALHALAGEAGLAGERAEYARKDARGPRGGPGWPPARPTSFWRGRARGLPRLFAGQDLPGRPRDEQQVAVLAGDEVFDPHARRPRLPVGPLLRGHGLAPAQPLDIVEAEARHGGDLLPLQAEIRGREPPHEKEDVLELAVGPGRYLQLVSARPERHDVAAPDGEPELLLHLPQPVEPGLPRHEVPGGGHIELLRPRLLARGAPLHDEVRTIRAVARVHDPEVETAVPQPRPVRLALPRDSPRLRPVFVEDVDLLVHGDRLTGEPCAGPETCAAREKLTS
ncbi:hypothetical protein GBA65_19405 [Rubrobacter marinus]|uniref:Uncharacterized protein n=1 Tax=Rubrobacter marinus TaxID=2653852 RepID=A0A6G8Q1K1_9ACTN|nr:hypothetical protein [Rubrobacter marinus]QIN80328.1 hypothetical protein GBA65_19405 [Rubrobacter marinus]